MVQDPADGLTVIQLLPELAGGGVERGVVEVSRALVERGHRSIVVSNGGRLVDELHAHGAEHITLPIHKKSITTLGTINPLRRLMRDTGAHVLHARSRVPAWAGYLAWRGLARGRRPAWVTTVHGLYSVGRYSRIMTTGQLVEVVSETVRDYVLRNYPKADPGKLVLNHRGVALEDFPHGYRPDGDWLAAFGEQYPQLRDPFVVTLAGRLTRLKGHHDLFDAIHRLRERGIDAHGLIVGGEDPRRLAYAKELRQAVKHRGLAEHITFTGHRSDMREILAVSGAVVSLSTKPESFGRSVLEAVRLGRPVVGYDHGGVGEVLGAVYPAGRTPLGDTAALADRLADIARGRTPPPGPTEQFPLSDMLDRSVALYQRAARLRGA